MKNLVSIKTTVIIILSLLTLQGCNNKIVSSSSEKTGKFDTDGKKNSQLDFMLLNGKIQVNQKDENQDTPLIYASRCGNVDLVRYLIRNGAEINYESDFSSSALHSALFRNNYDVAAILIKHGADPDLPPNLPLIFTAIKKGNIEMVFFLVESGSNINQIAFKGMTPLTYACWQTMLWSESEFDDREHKLFVYKYIIDYLGSRTSEDAKKKIDDKGNSYEFYLSAVSWIHGPNSNHLDR